MAADCGEKGPSLVQDSILDIDFVRCCQTFNEEWTGGAPFVTQLYHSSHSIT
jgi:hypothetical protein